MERESYGSFKDELKQRRKALDLTQAELAHKIGCSIYTLQHIEEGVARPSRQLAELLAVGLEIPPDERPAFVQRARAAVPRSATVSSGVDLEPTTPPIRACALSGRPMRPISLGAKL